MQIVKPNQTEIKIKKQFNMDADVGNKWIKLWNILGEVLFDLKYSVHFEDKWI